MSESTDLDLAEVFPTEREKRSFLRLVSSRHADASEEVDAMIENNDSDTFIEYLQLAGQPIYEAGWGALYHGASARFELYHFNGRAEHGVGAEHGVRPYLGLGCN
jgi:hypothetical protein